MTSVRRVKLYRYPIMVTTRVHETCKALQDKTSSMPRCVCELDWSR